MEETSLKTGTTTVGIVCKDGVVLAADKRATAGHMIVDKRADKVHVISDDFAVTIAGTVSDAQLVIKLIRAELKLKEVRTYKRPSAKEAANLLGGKDVHGLHLYDLFPDGSITRITDFISSGSGSVFAYGVLETQWKKDLSTDEAVALAVKSVNTALQRDSASGNGIDVIVINEKEIKRVLHKEVAYSL